MAVVPVVIWAVWLARNAVVFRGQPVYVKNVWEETVSLLKAWGRRIVGATSVLTGSMPKEISHIHSVLNYGHSMATEAPCVGAAFNL
ncbi:hypothetical protein QJS10_CPB17g00976 [Acorus calamus]|uniref:Uncharacterized protein n=1 Tax=Acorus calamus TaxID=4465 RepID=A0AAV9CUH0_ACOCL|nr:hypothetical protein QJS10_CPB17g00976 [Acorus calamus]